MTVYYVTRHPGAVQWAKINKIQYDIHVEHIFYLTQFNAGDVVIGTLPINQVYQLNQQGVRYIHMSLQIPRVLRGAELTAEQLEACKATLEEFKVMRLS